MCHHDQRRLRISPKIEQVVLQVGTGKGIEGGKRLIEQEHLRARHQRAQDGNPLGLPAEELARPHPCLFPQSYPIEGERNALRFLLFLITIEAEADIVGHAQPGQQPRLLKDDADLLVRR